MLLRQWLLSSSPLDAAWVSEVAAAEAEHWRRSSSPSDATKKRQGWSDEMLGFDCAGAQWVLEVAMPAGNLEEQSGNEMGFMRELLARIEGGEGGGGGGGGEKIPAHAPIEQRWTSGSRSALSPVAPPGGSGSGSGSGAASAELHSWVGIILYLPEDEASSREWRPAVDAAFREYSRIVERDLGPKHGATEHWAKVEPGRYVDGEGAEGGASGSNNAPLEEKRRRLERRFGRGNVAKFAEARRRLDPYNVMGGSVVDALFPHPNEKEGK